MTSNGKSGSTRPVTSQEAHDFVLGILSEVVVQEPLGGPERPEELIEMEGE